MTEPNKLVLWDIDLTLIRAGTAGRELYAAAFRRLTGRPLIHMVDAAGRMDPDIWNETLETNHLTPSSYSFSAFAASLAETYESGSDLLRKHGEVLPGATEALRALRASGRTVQTILTGNIAPVARVKLATFGLDGLVDLEIGTFGTDGSTRAALVRVARQRAFTKHRVPFDGPDTVVIGDSHHDVVAGHEAGARVIAVASGRTPFADLERLEPQHLLRDLKDTTAILHAVLDGKSRVIEEELGH